jgi:hypothetical protein
MYSTLLLFIVLLILDVPFVVKYVEELESYVHVVGCCSSLEPLELELELELGIP